MKKNKRIFQNISLLAILAFAFTACDEDFSTVGSEIIGDNNFETSHESYSVIAHNQSIESVRSNGLSTYLLGYYSDPTFGSSSASFVGQMRINEDKYDPIFGDEVVVDSVFLTIPYFSTLIDTDSNGNSTYELDSLYGGNEIKLQIYRNDYFLRDFDPNSDFDDALEYYTDETSSDGNTINLPINNTNDLLLYSNESFLPSSDQIILTNEQDGEDVITGRLNPSIRINLTHDALGVSIPQDYWKELFIDKEGQPELSNANNFMNYFRGLYIKAEQSTDSPSGSIMALGLSGANLTIYYSNNFDEDDTDNDGILNFADSDINNDGIVDNGPDDNNNGIKDDYEPTSSVQDEDGDGIIDNLPVGEGTFSLGFTGNIVNTTDNNFIPFPSGDDINGDDRLYLKGGSNGNIAILNLFNGDEDGNSTELDEFKSKNWLINEANLIFHVDQTLLNGNNEPDRLYIYDLKNNTPLIDYFLDRSLDQNSGYEKVLHSEPLTRLDNDPNGEGIKYKIRITEHINNIFLRDSTNVKLGLAITSNIGSVDNLNIKDFDESDLGVLPKSITSGSFLSPKGTILFGNNLVDETKKVKLEIFYTEPN